jgi:hypothetical protein
MSHHRLLSSTDMFLTSIDSIMDSVCPSIDNSKSQTIQQPDLTVSSQEMQVPISQAEITMIEHHQTQEDDMLQCGMRNVEGGPHVQSDHQTPSAGNVCKPQDGALPLPDYTLPTAKSQMCGMLHQHAFVWPPAKLPVCSTPLLLCS